VCLYDVKQFPQVLDTPVEIVRMHLSHRTLP
jgi:hypothetical protein